MADTFLFKNNAVSSLAVGVDAITTSLVLASGEGALFPSPAAGQRFALTLVDAGGNKEVCYCSARSGDTLTVSRGEESITAKAWQIADVVSLRITEGIAQFMLQGDDVVITDTNADKVDGFNANATPTPDTILPLDSNSKLPATAADADLLENNNSAYHLNRANHTGSQTVDAFTGRIGSELFAADGTFVVPAGVTELTIIGCGGAGGGAGGDGGGGIAGGLGGHGGAPGITEHRNITVIGGASMGVDVGTGGTGGSAGATSGGAGGVGGDGVLSKLTGPIINAGSLTTGKIYTIVTIGTTDFTLVGASANTIGIVFEATGAGTGTGTADETLQWLGGAGGASNGGATLGGAAGGSGPGGDGIDGYPNLPYGDVGGVGGAGGTGVSQPGSVGLVPDTLSFASSKGGSGGGGGGGGGRNALGGVGGVGGSGFILISW